jgi:Gene product 88
MAADMLRLSRPGAAEAVTGGLSTPGKMPCYAIGLSASRCRMGSILGQKEGNVCHEDVCYAKGGNYARTKVQDKMELRYQGLFNIDWTPALASLIHRKAEQYFRLFDSGDLQSVNHLKNIARVAEAVPQVIIWMPTREIDILRKVLDEMGAFPSNLIPRVSATRVDGKAPKGWRYTSSVVSDPEEASCISQKQGGKCDGAIDNCRACWLADHVTYQLH